MRARDVGLNYQRYTVTFSCDGLPDVVALLDEAPPQVTGGHGGWTVTTRERRIGLTQWQGNDPIRLAIPILFDHEISDIARQDIAIRTLQLMGRPPQLDEGEPPILTVDSKGIRYPTSKGNKQEWVIENLQWGTNVRNDSEPLRQDVVVNLLEYVDEDRVKFKAPSISPHRNKKKKNRTGAQKDRPTSKHGWPKFYMTQKGDTLPGIAARFYHDSSMWPRIAKANLIRDPRMLRPLFLLIIPPP